MKRFFNLKNGLLVAILGIATLGGLKTYDQLSAASSVLLKNTEALAYDEINPDCPNGCLVPPGYCWCFQPYPNEEAHWPN